MTWDVVMRPHDCGVLVYVTDGTTLSIVGRVAYRRVDVLQQDGAKDRARTGMLRLTFKSALRSAVHRAETEADRLNGTGESVP